MIAIEKNNKIDLIGVDQGELQEYFKVMGYEPYRVKQVLEWIYSKKVRSVDEMTNLSKKLREEVKREFYISNLVLMNRQESQDGTQKFLFELEDRKQIESVLIPEGNRSTLCLSTQVGCKFYCSFCYTGKSGFVRNLTTGEIINQILYFSQEGNKVTNIVLMGMGEPLDNYNNVIKAVKIIYHPWGLGISARKISLSTCGLIPALKKLKNEDFNINLVVSLNASDSNTRDKLMPVNKRHSLKELLKICREYPLKPGRRITFEYVLIKDINDSEEDAKRLSHLLRGIKCKINLIPFNRKHDGKIPYDPPDQLKVNKFHQYLTAQKYSVFIRKQRGTDISASCGQLTGQF